MFVVRSGVRVLSRATAAAPLAGRARAVTARRTGDQRDSLRPLESGTGLPTVNAGRGAGASAGAACARANGRAAGSPRNMTNASAPAATRARTAVSR